MKVIYTDDPQGKGTFHPKLGRLDLDVPFDLPDEAAKKYIDSGLLRKAPEEKKEVKTNGEPTYRKRDYNRVKKSSGMEDSAGVRGD